MYIIILNYCTADVTINKIDKDTNIPCYLKDNGYNEDEVAYMTTDNLNLEINI